VAVTAANTADRDVIDQLLDQPATGAAAPDTEPGAGAPAADADTATDTDEPAAGIDKPAPDTGNDSRGRSESKDFEVYGDSAYADGATLEEQTRRGHDMRTKVPPVRNANGYSKDQFRIDLAAGTVTCPAHHTVTIGGGRRHRSARFGQLCQSCSLRADCTKAHGGRVISIHPNEAALQHAKARQKDPAWQQDYRRYRPVVERKIGHFTRRPWGGRKARCRGSARILTDILTRASVINSPAWLPWACTKARPAGPLPDPTPGHQHYQHRNHMLPSVAPLLTHRPHRQPPHTGHYISGVLGSPRARARTARHAPARLHPPGALQRGAARHQPASQPRAAPRPSRTRADKWGRHPRVISTGYSPNHLRRNQCHCIAGADWEARVCALVGGLVFVGCIGSDVAELAAPRTPLPHTPESIMIGPWSTSPTWWRTCPTAPPSVRSEGQRKLKSVAPPNSPQWGICRGCGAVILIAAETPRGALRNLIDSEAGRNNHER